MVLGRGQSLRDALARMTSLVGGDVAVHEVAAFGAASVEPLRKILFAPDASGLFEIRCRAVEALAQVDAYDVLTDYLRSCTTTDDPVERIGDGVVIGAAAIVLARTGNQQTFDLLVRLTKRGFIVPGVISAIGLYHDPRSASLLVSALAEDSCRLAAERALRRLGHAAVPALLQVIVTNNEGGESASRRRRSVLKLLAEISNSKLDEVLSKTAADEDLLLVRLAEDIRRCRSSGAC